MSEELRVLHSEIMSCTKCELHRGRNMAVPGEGPIGAPVMFVGEGPGEKEDREGRPFVGAAGKFLSELLASIETERNTVFITNIVKCRPPGNRAPREGEIEACNGYLKSQIRMVNPRIICPLGTPAIKTLMGQEYTAGQAHGKPQRVGGKIILPLYHPAAALYDGSLRDVMFEDIKVLKQLIMEKVEPDNPQDQVRVKAEPLQKWL